MINFLLLDVVFIHLASPTNQRAPPPGSTLVRKNAQWHLPEYLPIESVHYSSARHAARSWTCQRTIKMRLHVVNVGGLNLLLVSAHFCFYSMRLIVLFFFFLVVAYENLPTKTYSSPNAFPSSLRSKRALVQNKLDAGEAAKGRDPVVSRWVWVGGWFAESTFYAILVLGPRKMSKVWSYRS